MSIISTEIPQHPVKTWFISNDKSVEFDYKNGSSQFSIIQNGKKFHVPEENIVGIPPNIRKNFALLSAFLKNTYVQIGNVGDTRKVYVQGKIRGGGKPEQDKTETQPQGSAPPTKSELECSPFKVYHPV